MKKRVIGCFLSMALMVAMVMPVSAEEADLTLEGVELNEAGNAAEIEIEGVVEQPDIDVTVKAASNIILNPYNLAVEIGEDEVTDAILGVDTTITNDGATPIWVDVTVTGSLGEGSGATFLTADPTAGTKPVTTKGVYMWGEFSAPYETPEAEGTADVSFAPGYSKDDDLLVGTKALSKANAINLENALDGTATLNNVSFRLTGVANGKASEVWTEADTVKVAVVFSFRPTTEGMKTAE